MSSKALDSRGASVNWISGTPAAVQLMKHRYRAVTARGLVYEVLKARTSEKNGAPPTMDAAAGSVTTSASPGADIAANARTHAPSLDRRTESKVESGRMREKSIVLSDQFQGGSPAPRRTVSMFAGRNSSPLMHRMEKMRGPDYTLDLDRLRRVGFPEVVLAEGKSTAQIGNTTNLAFPNNGEVFGVTNTKVATPNSQIGMNEIKADCDGEVATVYVKNGQAVQFGERLFAIKVS